MASSKKMMKKVGVSEQLVQVQVPATMRKGPWTEEEDAQLVWFVRLFGERRWDFLAKVSGLRGGGCVHVPVRACMCAGRRAAVRACMRRARERGRSRQWPDAVSLIINHVLLLLLLLLLPLSACVRFSAPPAGLRRSGKSCRLRWVNYLHPGLRRGRITADEERLILSLHAQWGSRWSRIARSLPGRTDNEIKNYWRTRMRKKAHEERQHGAASKASASSSSSSSSRANYSCSAASPNTSTALQESSSSGGGGTDDEAASTAAASQHKLAPPPPQQQCFYTMDQLWDDIAAAEAAASYVADAWGPFHDHAAAAAEEPSPAWELWSDCSLWRIDDEEYYKKMLDSS